MIFNTKFYEKSNASITYSLEQAKIPNKQKKSQTNKTKKNPTKLNGKQKAIF